MVIEPVLALCLLTLTTASNTVDQLYTSEKVSFVGTPNITEEENAFFRCSSNLSVGIKWQWYNEIDSLRPLPNSFNVSGDGTSNSTLTIPGEQKFNNSKIQCYIDSPLTGNISPSPVTLRIQGKLDEVDSLVQSFSCCYNFSWSPPFTLPGVPILRYNINVTINKTVWISTFTIQTKWEYCPEKFGNHTVSVAAVNSVGEGNITTKTLDIKYRTKACLRDQYRDYMSQNWILIVQISAGSFQNWLRCINNVTLHFNNSHSYVAVSIDGDGLSYSFQTSYLPIQANMCVDTLSSVANNSHAKKIYKNAKLIYKNAKFNISDSAVDDKRLNFTPVISFEKSLESRTDNNLTISFFDVYDFQVPSKNSIKVSFMCRFMNGSKAIGCYVLMNDTTTGKNYSLNITRENSTVPNKTGFIRDIQPGQYNVSVYDINSNDLIAALPAKTLNDVNIEGANGPINKTELYIIIGISVGGGIIFLICIAKFPIRFPV